LGTGGFDVVRGGDGNDTIAVSTFQSEYFGGRGNDKFFSVGWQNEFNGGGGRDTITYELRDEDPTLGGSAVAVDLAAGRAFTGASRTEILTGIENVIGTGFSDELLGNGGGNRLEGRRGADSLGGKGGSTSFSAATATTAWMAARRTTC
jgi:serralysin